MDDVEQEQYISIQTGFCFVTVDFKLEEERTWK